MWLIFQQSDPDDYVIATGKTHSVGEFLSEAFSYVNRNWQDYVELDENICVRRKSIWWSATPAQHSESFNWKPKAQFRGLVRLMVDAATLSTGKQNQVFDTGKKVSTVTW